MEKVLKCNDGEDVMTEKVFIKIGIVGEFMDADLKLISKGRGIINFIAKCVLKVYFGLYCIYLIFLNLASLLFNSEKKNTKRWTYLDGIFSTLLSK